MEIEIKEIENCKLAITYMADAGEILEKRSEILKHFKKAPVPGCRAGRASIDAIKMHYKSQIENSLKKALAEDAYHNTIFEKELRPHGAPAFNSAEMVEKGFECKFDLNVKPDFKLEKYRDFKIPKPHQEVTVSDLSEKMIQELRIRFGTSIPYEEDDIVQLGDNIILNYDGFVDGEKQEALSAEGEMLTIGSSQLLDFDNNILGMPLGEMKEFNLVVPEEGLPSLAGKTITFKVTVTMGSKQTPAPLDDEFAKKLGKKEFAELKSFVNMSAAAKLDQSYNNLLTEKIASLLIENHDFEAPNWLVLSEARYLTQQSKLDWEKLADLDKEKYMEMANKNVNLSLILDRIRDDEPEAQLSEEEVFEIIKQNIAKSQSESTPDEIIKEMSKTGYLQILFSRIKDEYTLDFIIKTSEIIE